jgi:hypothetical protein
MKYHLSASIEGLLKNCTTKKLGKLFNMPGLEAKKELLRLKAKGHTLIPAEGCDNFDPFEHGCLGHLDDSGENNPCLVGKINHVACKKETCQGCEFYQPETRVSKKELSDELL